MNELEETNTSVARGQGRKAKMQRSTTTQRKTPREHAGALALASLGTQEDPFCVLSDCFEPTWGSSSTDAHAPIAVKSACVTLRDYSMNARRGGKRKLSQVEHQPVFTWPSLEFSPTLKPLEVRVNMAGGSREKPSTYQVIVAKSMEDARLKSSNLDFCEDMFLQDEATSQTSDDQLTTPEQSCSQSSDWHFLASQASLLLDELPDSESLSQMSSSHIF